MSNYLALKTWDGYWSSITGVNANHCYIHIILLYRNCICIAYSSSAASPATSSIARFIGMR